MRVWLKILVGVLVLVVVLVAGGVLFISQMDPNEYRGLLSDAVERATGRRLHVGGDLRIKLLPLPSLEANEVSFANAPWASQPDMVRAQRLRAEVELMPLLSGRVIVRRFVAIEPRVFLETAADGRNNWEFGDEATSRIEPDVDKPSGELRIAVGEVRVEQAGLDYLDAKAGTRTVVDVAALRLSSEKPGAPLSIDLRASYQNLPVTLKGNLGAPEAFVRNQPIDFSVEGSVGEAGLTVQGSVAEPLNGKGLKLKVSLESPSTKTITDAAGIELEELGPVVAKLTLDEADGRFHFDPLVLSARPRGTDARISGSVRQVAPHHLSRAAGAGARGEPMTVDLAGQFGDSRFSVTGQVGDPIGVRDLRLDIAADVQSTLALTELANVEFEETGPVKLSLTLLENGGHYDFHDIELSARPRNIAASLGGSVENVVARVDAGKAQAEPAKVNVKGTLGDARFAIDGTVGKPLEGKDLHLKLALETKSTVAFTDLADLELEELGPLDVALTVIEKDGKFDLDAIDLSARPRDAQVTVKGAIANVAGDPRPDLNVTVAAKSLRQLDATLPAAGPVSVMGTVRPSDKVVEIHNLVATVGKSDLSGSATIDTRGERPRASAKLSARNIDLVELTPTAEKAGDKPTTKSPSDGKIFSGDPLPLDLLNEANGDVELSVGRLHTRDLTLDDVKVAAKLDDGSLTLEPAAYVAGGKVGGKITIDSRTQPATFSADVEAKGVSIGTLTKQLRGFETSQGLDSNLNVTLRGEGNSVRAIMAGLDGDLQLVVGEGSVNNDVLDRVGADLMTQIISVAVPTSEEKKTTKLQCGVVRFKVVDGQALADKTLVMETEKVLLMGGGLVDLKTEDLDLGANLAARQGIRIGAGTLSSLMRVQGTLAKPRIGTDLQGVAKTGARIGAAVATAGLSLLAESVYGRISEDQHPCQTALNRTIDISPSELKSLLGLE